MKPMNLYRYPWDGSNARFGPLLPFVGGLVVGGLFAPRPGPFYGNNAAPAPTPAPNMPAYPPSVPLYPYPVPYAPAPYPVAEIPTYYTTVQAENVDLYPRPY